MQQLLSNIGNILYEQGHLAKSQQYFTDSIALGRQINSKAYLAWALGAFADSQIAQADFDGARKSLEAALTDPKALVKKISVAGLQEEIALLRTEEGHPN